jgi:hypothetical protein
VKKKIIQVPVVVGKGATQIFLEKDIKISPPSPPIYKIEKIDKWVDVYSYHVIPGKVIFNAYLWKNIAYKTVEDVCDGVVNGPIYHSTFKVPFGGFVEIEPIGCKEIKEDDVAELLEAFVEGEKDFLHDECKCKGQKVFNRLLEKDVIKVAFKVIRIEHIPLICDDEKDDKFEHKKDKCDDKRDDKFDEKKYEKEDKFDKKDDWRKEKYYDDKRFDCRGDYYARCRGKYY